jgi:tRNA(Ile)-lysidine synthase
MSADPASADERFLAELSAALDRAAARSRAWRSDGVHSADAAPAASPPRLAVALSGGLDSSVLLAAVARLEPRPSMRALHVDHALHPDSAVWDAHCAAFAEALGVPYRSVRVEVDRSLGIGVEAAARAARYAALAELVDPGEILLTAHHADDVLETLLHRLVRGTGVRGLRGVLPHARLGRGFVVRPLLGFERAELRAVAERWRIEWLEDPSNRSLDYDRNYLRAEVLPALKRRWPRAPQAALRLTAAAADAEEILEAAAEADLAGAGGGDGDVAVLAQLSPARRRNALRHAIASAGLPMPSARQLETLAAALVGSRSDASTRIGWPGAEARVYRGRLYLLAPLDEPALALRAPREMLSSKHPLNGAAGRLVLEPTSPQDAAAGERTAADGTPEGLPDALAREGLEVRFRRGGERFKPSGSAHHRKLKHWFQEQGIVPWMRGRIPLLYWRGRLVAVADLAVAADLPRSARGERAWRVRWDAHPPIR